MNEAYLRCLFTQLPSNVALVHPVVGWIVENAPASRGNSIYLTCSGKLTEVQLYESTSC